MLHLVLVLSIVVGTTTYHARIYEGPFSYAEQCDERAGELTTYTKVRMGFLTGFKTRVTGEWLCYRPERRA